MANPNPVTRFQPNNCANPNGRPKKEFSITNAFKEVLSEQNPETKIEKYKELINKALQMAMRGDGDMIKYIINRLEGMPQGSQPLTAVQINNNMAYTDEQIDAGVLAVLRERKHLWEEVRRIIE